MPNSYNTHTKFAAGFLAAAVVIGCVGGERALATSDALEKLLEQCGGNANNTRAKVRYCSLVIQQPNVPDEDLAFAYASRGGAYYNDGDYERALDDFNVAIPLDNRQAHYYEYRAYTLDMLGDHSGFMHDMSMAEWASGDPRYAQIAEERDQEVRGEKTAARDASRRITLAYNGLWCGSVQQDSVLYPANEVVMQVFVHSIDGSEAPAAINIPNKGYIPDVVSGYASIRGSQSYVWEGGAGPIKLSVAMWEYDDGGPAVEVLSFWAVMGMSARSSGGGKGYPPGGRVGSPSTGATSPGLIDGAIAKLAGSALGTNNDLMGVAHSAELYPADFAESPEYERNGFKYHIYTTHRQSGANCEAYFSFVEDFEG